MKEAYCSFEISKLLKEKRFDEPCFTYYNENGNFKRIGGGIFGNGIFPIRNETNFCFFGIAAPTHQAVVDWIEEKYKYFIIIYRNIDSIYGTYTYSYSILDKECKCVSPPITRDSEYPSKYDAVDAALMRVLENLI